MLVNLKLLIFVTYITFGICGEKSFIWRNFRFQCMRDGEKPIISPPAEELQTSLHNRCEEILNIYVFCCKICFVEIYDVLLWFTGFCVEKDFAKNSPTKTITLLQNFWSADILQMTPLITKSYFRDGIYGCIWLQEAMAHTKTQFHRKKLVHASKASPQIWIRRMANLMGTMSVFQKFTKGWRRGGVAEPAWLWESQLRMATILGLVNTGEAILHWEDGPTGTKMQPSVWGHMPRMQGSLSESVFVHHPVTFLEVILPCCPNCTWTCIANSIVVSTKVKHLFSHIFPVSTWSPYSW